MAIKSSPAVHGKSKGLGYLDWNLIAVTQPTPRLLISHGQITDFMADQFISAAEDSFFD
ncbi:MULTISPECIES: hypothetical protein [Rhizobium/Agrobacterium group]|uniref:Transposase n=1 Tax=Agrobacterium vitis TaxID=373 RepID=A0ABD6H1T5_AGRVI|nr:MULTISPECIES: hypothetical protein [Rhizobium/Agrobacterium group]MUO28299.1 hypothetical protein [Agrobacterium vitis]MUO41181.1 hypothetical protein [Agrobacterium vitis]MUO88905.1 hypothetical protein [Agrobacterium vitis]MUP08785.1 hypothetical protein [Agrobacterium vitis]MUZ53344.1 hypothetical protein [Agrobacterium vitis]